MASSGSKAGSEAAAPATTTVAAAATVPSQAPAAGVASVGPGGSTSSVQTEAMKQILGVIDKKLRNLEKKKVLRALANLLVFVGH